jgi:hypothetical protein
MFVKNESSIVIVKDFFEFVRKNDSYKVLELLLYLFSQNVDLLTPLSDDVCLTKSIYPRPLIWINNFNNWFELSNRKMEGISYKRLW